MTSTAHSSASSSTEDRAGRKWQVFVQAGAARKVPQSGLDLEQAPQAIEPGSHGWGSTDEKAEAIEAALSAAGYGQDGLSARFFDEVQADMLLALQEALRARGLGALVDEGEAVVPGVWSRQHTSYSSRASSMEPTVAGGSNSNISPISTSLDSSRAQAASRHSLG